MTAGNTLRTLRVVATLAQGYCTSDPWSPALDGILAYHQLHEQLGDEEFALGMSGHRPIVVPTDLPLGQEHWDDQWWWQCSAPITAPVGQFRRYFHRRFDIAPAIDLVSEQVKRVRVSAGPYKIYRNGRQITLAPDITWHCIGDPVAIRDLLRDCTHIGQGRGRGWGEVRDWQVHEDGDEMLARFHRPLPVEFARAHGVSGSVQQWGIRPPGRLPAHQLLCVMPAG